MRQFNACVRTALHLGISTVILLMDVNCGLSRTAEDINAVVTCEIKLFQNYFIVRRCPGRNNFFAQNYFKIVSGAFAAHEYFPTR